MSGQCNITVFGYRTNLINKLTWKNRSAVNLKISIGSRSISDWSSCLILADFSWFCPLSPGKYSEYIGHSITCYKNKKSDVLTLAVISPGPHCTIKRHSKAHCAYVVIPVDMTHNTLFTLNVSQYIYSPQIPLLPQGLGMFPIILIFVSSFLVHCWILLNFYSKVCHMISNKLTPWLIELGGSVPHS